MSETLTGMPASTKSRRRAVPGPTALSSAVGGSVGVSVAYRVAGLVFLAYPIVALIVRPASPVVTVLVLAATALFGGLLIVASRVGVERWRSNAVGAILVVLLLSIAILLVLVDPDYGFYPFFYFASAGASTLAPARRAIALMVLAGVAAAFAFAWARLDLASAIVQGLSVTIIGVTIFSASQARRANRQLVEARNELARSAVADERARIARDLHDTLGQSLSVIALKSELAGRLVADDPDRARTEILDVQYVARNALASVRETVADYRRPTLETELEEARKTLAAANIEATIRSTVGQLPAGVDAVLAWAVREGVTNIVRHSGATRAAVAVTRSRDWAEAEISDDGLGAAVKNAAARSSEGGFGLVGLSERVSALGGRLASENEVGGGFRLTVSLPLDSAAT